MGMEKDDLEVREGAADATACKNGCRNYGYTQGIWGLLWALMGYPPRYVVAPSSNSSKLLPLLKTYQYGRCH